MVSEIVGQGARAKGVTMEVGGRGREAEAMAAVVTAKVAGAMARVAEVEAVGCEADHCDREGMETVV